MRTFLVRFATLLLVTAPVAGQPPPAQPPGVTFRVEVNYVEVDAVVTDASGRFVRNLTADDFEIYEDGRRQKVTAFGQVDIPIDRVERPLFTRREIEPDVQTNERPFDGRLYVIVLDDIHTHPLRSVRVKRAARQFIERNLAANDLAAVVHTSGRTDAGQEFTSSRRLLVAAIDKFMGRKLRSSTLERIDEYERTRGIREGGSRVNDPLEVERGFQARNTLSVLKNIADYMAGLHGRRKALLFISEGIDYDIYDVFNNQYGSTILDEAREAIAASTRSSVSIFSIDPRGLTGGEDESIEIAGLPDDASLGLGPGSIQEEIRRAQDSLRTLAEETGGFAAVNQNEFQPAFDRIVRDNSAYYLLGYYPTNSRRDGRFRKIEVRVTRPGLTVRARRGYVAPRGRAPEPRRVAEAGVSAPLAEALNSPMPLTRLPLRLFAAPFRGAAPNASVSVTLRVAAGDLKFVERNGVHEDTLDVLIAALDYNGKLKASDKQTLDLKLRPQTYEAVRRGGLRLMSRLAVPPGRYQLRVAVHERGAGLTGSVHTDIEVPEFDDRLSMSGLILTARSAGFVPTARFDDQLKAVLPSQPSTERQFTADDELALFVEVYDNVAGRPHRVDIVTTVTADAGRQVFRTEDTRESAELGGKTGGYGHTARVPLAGMDAGLYVLRVEARSRLGGDTVFREISFEIVPGPPAPGR
jgi:VWFA-related protein